MNKRSKEIKEQELAKLQDESVRLNSQKSIADNEHAGKLSKINDQLEIINLKIEALNQLK